MPLIRKNIQVSTVQKTVAISIKVETKCLCLTQYKLNKQYTRAFSRIITKYSDKTANNWLEPFGYTVNVLRSHIEALFEEGMTWDNYGEWHIDHIKPVSAFDFTLKTDLEFIACWQLSNLQPLWAKDNLTKGGMNTQINKDKYGTEKTTALHRY